MAEIRNKQDITLKELILYIRRWCKFLSSKWYIILIVAFFGAAAGFLYANSRDAIYTSTTTFVLESGEKNGGGLGQMASLAALAGVDLGPSGGGIFQGDNLFELYRSRKMIESVLLSRSASDNSRSLLDRYLVMTKAKERWEKKSPELLNIDFAKNKLNNHQRERDSILQDAVRNINKNHLFVGKNDKKSSIIRVDVESPDEVFSKEFNEALVNQVNEFFIKTKTRKSLDYIEILQQKTDSVRLVMNRSISDIAVAIDATPNLNPTRQVQRLVPTQRSQFSAEANKAILGQLIQNLEMAKMNLMKEAPLIQKVDEPVLPLDVDRLSKLKAMLIGGFLFTFLSMFFLMFWKGFTNIMS